MAYGNYKAWRDLTEADRAEQQLRKGKRARRAGISHKRSKKEIIELTITRTTRLIYVLPWGCLDNTEWRVLHATRQMRTWQYLQCQLFS